jgi:hypothetical protein
MKLIRRARETRAGTEQHGKPRAGDLRAALEIDDPERWPEIPVRLRCEGERSRRADTANFLVVVCAFSDRDARMRNVGDDEHRLMAPLFEFIDFGACLLDLRRALTIDFLNLCRVLSLPLRLRNLVGRRLLLALQPFELRQQPTTTGLERGKLIELTRQVGTAIGKCGADCFDVVAEKGGIDHVCALAFTSYNSARLVEAHRGTRACLAEARRANAGYCDRIGACLARFAKRFFLLQASALDSSRRRRRSRRKCSCSSTSRLFSTASKKPSSLASPTSSS